MTEPPAPIVSRRRLSTPRAWAAAVGGMLVAVGWIHAAQILAPWLPPTAPQVAGALYYLLLFGPLIALAAALGWVCGVRPFRLGAYPVRWAMIGGALGAMALATSAWVAWRLGVMTSETAPPPIAATMLAGAALVLMQVSAEEALSRGWLQTLLADLVGAPAGIVLAAAAFAGLHLIAGPVSPLALLNTVLAGVFFGVLAHRSGGVVAPIAGHFAWNIVEDQGLGLVPNPGVSPFGAVRDYALGGQALWGGGVEGLNASVATTVALVVVIGVLAAHRSPRPAVSA